MLQALPVFEQSQLLAPVARDMAVGADGERGACVEPRDQVGGAVAEIRLGRRADDGARATAGDAINLCRRDVRGMNQLPAAVERMMFCEPFNGTQAGDLDAFLDLAVCSAT